MNSREPPCRIQWQEFHGCSFPHDQLLTQLPFLPDASISRPFSIPSSKQNVQADILPPFLWEAPTLVLPHWNGRPVYPPALQDALDCAWGSESHHNESGELKAMFGMAAVTLCVEQGTVYRPCVQGRSG